MLSWDWNWVGGWKWGWNGTRGWKFGWERQWAEDWMQKWNLIFKMIRLWEGGGVGGLAGRGAQVTELDGMFVAFFTTLFLD